MAKPAKKEIAKPAAKVPAKPAAKAVPAPIAPSRQQAAKRGLGRGLSALMSDSYSHTAADAFDDAVVVQQKKPEPEAVAPAPERGAGVIKIDVTRLRSGKYQPRGYFDETALAGLADSIRKNGIMQPILVRPLEGDEYEIIAGERRWRAAKIAGLTEVPALIRADIVDRQALELALVENVQREGLHPLEEAAGYRRLMDEFDYTQEDLSQVIHKSRSHVANLLRLLTLPPDIRLLFADDKISMGHARALMGMEEEDAVVLANEVVSRELSVRQTEKFARDGVAALFTPRKPTREQSVMLGLSSTAAPAHHAMPAAPVEAAAAKPRDPDIMALEETLSENLGLKVRIQDRGQSGEITLVYESLEQLDEILRRLGGSI